MDARLLLVKAITLIYRDSQLDVPQDDVRKLVAGVLEQVKLPEKPVLGGYTHDSVTSLMETVKWMMSMPENYKYSLDDLLQRLRIGTDGDDTLYDALLGGIQPALSNEELIHVCRSHKDALRILLNQNKLKQIIGQYYVQCQFKPESIDWRNIARTITEELAPLDKALRGDTNNEHPAVVDSVSLSNRDQVQGLFQQAMNDMSPSSYIRTPWQGLTRMVGGYGFMRGEMCVLGALQHNYKTGTGLNVLKGHALYNKPYMLDPNKKPMIVRFSFETSARYDIMFLYKNIIENETKMPIDISEVDIYDAAQFIESRLGGQGYEVQLLHVNPSDYTYRDIIDKLQAFEAQGYEVHQLNLDYLNMISKRGCTPGPAGFEVQDLFKRVRNYIHEKKIFTFTPHQLSSDAKQIVRDGGINFVQQIANKGYYADCKGIDREVDLELYQHIVKVNGESYLTIQRGKHRKVGVLTPERDLYCVYKFSPIGDIQDDINGNDMSRKRVGADAASEGGGLAWYDQ